MNVLYFDGAADPNPGHASFGFSHMIDEKEVAFSCGYIGVSTNNVAEYTALLKALEYCKLNNVTDAQIFGDSLLVVNQMNGTWKTKSDHLLPLQKVCKNLASELGAQVRWVSRVQNSRADYLSKVPVSLLLP
mgnify:CR=1 FL=1|tara:strand:+ start:560 stop:955 length:396 start_codon:yes stop_codon:yes gene_type:complete